MEKVDFKDTGAAPMKGIKKFSDFEGGWDDYKRYLHSKGALNPNLDPNYTGISDEL